MTLDPDDMPGGWADSLAQRDAEIDALCAACDHWYPIVGDLCGFCIIDLGRAQRTALSMRLAPTPQGARP